MDSNPEFSRIRIEVETGGGAPSIVVHLSIDPATVHLRDTQLGTRVLLDGWPLVGRVGGPGLPATTLWIALPDRMEVKGSVLASAAEESPITDRPTRIAPVRAPRRDEPDRSRSPVLSVTRRPELYRAEEQEPRPLARLLGTESVGQTAIALVEVNPVFTGPTGNLMLITELRISLPLIAAAVVSPRRVSARSVVPVSPAQFDRLHQIARAVVANPADVVPPRDLAMRDRSTRWDYVIITDDLTWNAPGKTPITAISPSIVNAFQALASWKTSLGLKACVVRVTDIMASRAGVGLGADFATGAADVQQAIRRFLRYAHDQWGTAYVLLGGDDRIVPIRRLAIGKSSPSLPTDLYYCALDPRNDEWAEGRSLDYGAYGFSRLMPNVSIGRAPAANASEAMNFVTKLIGYEAHRTTANGLAASWLERILYVSTKWGGDVQTEVTPAPSFPPGDNQYALVPDRTRAVIKLIDTVRVTQDPDANTTSPADNCFNRAPGKAYVKIHLTPTYKNPQDIVANSTNSTIALSHNERACATIPGWFYTDWVDHDGPCHDASGQNYASAWIIVYLPAGTVPRSFDVRLNPALRMDYTLLSKVGPGDYRPIGYDIAAPTTGHGWFFSVSPTDPVPSPVDATAHQVPTPWLAVYADAQERAPKLFVLDPAEQADTMREQETLRKRILGTMPGWDAESALYPDVADLPVPDRAGIDVRYYTKDRLRTMLNLGQHIVSIGGHGNVGETCCSDAGEWFDRDLADQLTNAPTCGILYANSCLTNRYTEDSLSRHLVMRNPHGGMVAYLGYLDVISIGLGHAVENKFFADLASTGVLGSAFDARASMVVPGSGFDVNSADVRYTVFMMGLLGDPALRVHGAVREYLMASALAAAPDASGRLNTIYVRPDHRLARIAQNPGGWARAAVIDRGSWASRFALAANSDGRLEVFYTGSDSKVYHLWQTAPNAGWTQSFVLDNGSFAKQLAVGANSDGRLEVFYTGSDDKVYHLWQTAPNAGWLLGALLGEDVGVTLVADVGVGRRPRPGFGAGPWWLCWRCDGC
ncbi:MAG: C25 family cysteine peptidase, partial [Candidatus Nanopelagicales bacterium]